MLSPIILISSCFLDAMLMLSFVQISLEVSSTSTSTFPRVLIVPPLLSLQVVTLMRYTIIKTATTLVLLVTLGSPRYGQGPLGPADIRSATRLPSQPPGPPGVPLKVWG